MLRWDGSGLAPAPDDSSPLEAADSWLVVDGRVRGLDLHRERFLAAAGSTDASAFLDAAIAALPAPASTSPASSSPRGPCSCASARLPRAAAR
ncbi:hypothetical protein Q0F99_20245 [Rathayibacter oskolensis]|uniref:hypothetical protein n=1 Tax=Rathayibacter oskolensis TaxID=1891671 RepID=UPI00265E6610|nr:hypothetical protein [Rathayibacter oskolensis]WKK71610.1 hypothetical protein Q0F99_20245 [Rathayibacter oskolensis]